MAQEKVWEDYFHEIYAMEEIDETAMENDYEHLCELESSPLNINTLNPEDLYLIPGINRDQIDDIIKYRDRYGEFRTIEELALIESIDRPLRLFLSNFIVAEPTVKRAEKFAKGEEQDFNGIRAAAMRPFLENFLDILHEKKSREEQLKLLQSICTKRHAGVFKYKHLSHSHTTCHTTEVVQVHRRQIQRLFQSLKNIINV